MAEATLSSPIVHAVKALAYLLACAYAYCSCSGSVLAAVRTRIWAEFSPDFLDGFGRVPAQSIDYIMDMVNDSLLTECVASTQ